MGWILAIAALVATVLTGKKQPVAAAPISNSAIKAMLAPGVENANILYPFLRWGEGGSIESIFLDQYGAARDAIRGGWWKPSSPSTNVVNRSGHIVGKLAQEGWFIPDRQEWES